MARRSLSRGDVLLLVAALAAFGIVVSAYLAWQWYAAATAPWCEVNPFLSCAKVRDSPYAAVGGIPTAWVGVLGFAVLLGLAVLAFRGVSRLGPWSTDRWLFAFAAIGAAIGVGLTLIEVFVIEAICILCVIGFALDLGILGLAAVLPAADA